MMSSTLSLIIKLVTKDNSREPIETVKVCM